MIINLSTELLRTFIAIADSGNFSLAAEQVNRTQSAVSMQVKRLEELIDKPLFIRDSRNLKLTADGLTLMSYARRILKLNEEAVSLLKRPELSGSVSIGLPDDYVTRFLPEILAGFSRNCPRVQVDVTCEPSHQLNKRMKRLELDLAITTSPTLEVENTILLQSDPMVWVTSEQHFQHEKTPLPVALFPDECYSRSWAIKALEKADIDYRIAYTSATLMGLKAAVMAGLAVAAISRSIIPPGIRELSIEEGFPSMPRASFLLHRNPESEHTIVDSLAEHICKAFSARSD
jgi:DNA-binding transcriptional LysR family regulator